MCELPLTPGADCRLPLRIISIPFLVLLFTACAPTRAPIPVGVIPLERTLLAEDEEYGHQVFAGLTEQYPIDDDDGRINKVRDLVDKLSVAAKADKNPWHVYVLVDDNFKNAAATRGNYIFVWTGLLKSIKNDAELATVVSHEIGHLLAGHTDPDPQEELSAIIAGVAGSAGSAVANAHPSAGIAPDLAELILRESIKALILNPELQRKELEADHIGMFLMAEAGIEPEQAVKFWARVQNDPEFSNFPLEFLSSHPSSETRLKKLRSYLYQANEKYIENLKSKKKR